MTARAMIHQARLLDESARSDLVKAAPAIGMADWYTGRADGFRLAARWLRRAAATEDGGASPFEVAT